MKRTRFAAFMLIVPAVLLTLSPASNAGWMDDWIQQKTSTSPQYFEGQKRGYATGGSFSARWYTGSDSLVSISMPKLKTGCGGVDLFMGGFSFLNTDYLVQKLQRMIQAAPAIAFDMALSVLTEKLGASMKDFENIVNKLNGLQLDECKTGKVIATEILSPFSSKIAEQRAQTENEWLTSSGVGDLVKQFNKERDADGGKPKVSDSKLIQNCPDDLKAVFLASNGKTVLQELGARKGYSDEQIDIIRGLVGDIKATLKQYSDGTDVFIPDVIQPCDTDPERAVDFFNGKAQKRPADGSSCQQVTGAKANLQQWVSTLFYSIGGKISDKSSTLTADEKDIIQASPVPVYSALKMARTTGQNEAIIGDLSTVVAKAYAYSMMADLYNSLGKMLITAQGIMARQGKSPQEQCKMEIAQPVMIAVQEKMRDVYPLAHALMLDYANSVKEVSTLQQLAFNFERFNEMARKELSKHFGMSMANRAVGQ